MKFTTRQKALALGALSAVAAPALADNASGAAAELVLYVVNTANNTAYSRGLQINMNSLAITGEFGASNYTSTFTGKISASSVTEMGMVTAEAVANGFSTGYGSQNVLFINYTLPTILADTNLTNFLSVDPNTSHYKWSIQSSGIGGGSGVNFSRRFITTSASNFDNGTNVTTGNLGMAGSDVNAWSDIVSMVALDNAANPSTTNGDGTSITNSNYLSYTGAGAPGGTATTWFSNWIAPGGVINALQALGSASNLYEVVSCCGSTQSSSSNAWVFTMNDVVMDTAGNINLGPPGFHYLIPSISGLDSGKCVVLNDGSSWNQTISRCSNGSPAFVRPLDVGASYNVTITSQPPSQFCSLSNASGIVGTTDVTDIGVSCTSAWSIGGNIAGLEAGRTITLANGNVDSISLSSNGSFAFPISLPLNAPYSVSIASQPIDETCFTSNAIGFVEGVNVTNVSITCTPNTYIVGGSVTGLGSGKSLVIKNNGSDTTNVNSNGNFYFPTELISGSGYSVTIETQPFGQLCTVANGSGVVSGAAVNNVSISCSNISIFSVGGNLSGLASGKSVILRNNGSDTLILNANGGFTFSTPLSLGANYSVGVAIQPAGQTCLVSNGSGTVTTNITNVNVSCSGTYTVSGNITGLTSTGLVLRLNATSLIIANGASTFKFATALTDNTPYSVSVGIQPLGMSCSVSNGAGVINSANITNVAVTCNQSYTVSGSITGLVTSGLVLKLNGGANKIVPSGSNAFAFSTSLITGTPYAVTIQQQPTGETCLLFNASGTIASSNVSNVSITCSINTYTIGGTVAGLGAGNTLVLKNNGGNSLVISANGSFTFTNPMTSGSSYSVSIGFQPAGQNCVLQNASGTVISTNISNVSVACGPYNVSGTITGLTASGLVLQLNGANDLNVAANASGFAFPATLNGGQNYAVTVSSQPAGLGCTVSSGTGSIGNLNITNVAITCLTPPAAPVATVSYNRNPNQVILNWTLVPGATYYTISKDPTGSAGYSPICQANSPTATTCIDVFTKLTEFITASYKVSACNAAGCNASAPIAGFTTQTIQYIKASNTAAGDWFGFSLALSEDGSTLAVGAFGEASAATGINGNQADNSAQHAGAVYVYTRSGSTWSQQAYIKASNTNANDWFGYSVALSADGSTLAVGAYGEASATTGINGNQADNSAPEAGAVYVYTRSGSTWGQQAYIKASNTNANDWFGQSVALSADGSTLAVGAWSEASSATGINGTQADNSASGAGAVYVYTRSGSTWNQQAYIKASNSDVGDHFGWSVALSADGSTLAVGAHGESSAATGINGNQVDNSAPDAGAVYVFTRSGSTWSQQTYLKASNTNAGDQFGRLALSADGSTLAVGAWSEDSSATGINGNQADNGASGAGAVYVFTRSGTTWSQQAYIKASNSDVSDVGDTFGWSVALSADGSTLAVGAYGESSAATGINGNQVDNSAPDAGAVYVFTRSGSTWNQQTYLKASNTNANDWFGQGVALSADGSTLAVGAWDEASAATGINGNQADNSAPEAGAVYVY